MKVMKLVVTVIDFDELGEDGVRDAIETAHYPNHRISLSVRSVEVRDIGEWNDEHPLNHRDKQETKYAHFFET